MQNTQTLAKHTRDTVEILVSLKLMQTGKPDEAELVIDQVKLVVLHYTGNAGSMGHRQGSVPEYGRMLQLDDLCNISCN